MVIVDSSVWIDALRGTANPHSSWLKRSLGNEPIAMTSIILCEVLQGIRTDAQFEQSRQKLLELPVFETFAANVAIAAARNYRLLRSEGFTVRKPIDCMIATFCIESEYRLLHRDRDFDAFEIFLGLQVLHPPQTPSR
jgi:predicted nucleic acid-binding protein